ncbi:MAG: PEP-CTERM sorting domain-containing protein [Acidobacteria bacterium]|nr:PEP-CTERM sorting domain-containing protein [Acidobacteriota bacterium]
MRFSLGLTLAVLGALSCANAAPLLYNIQFTATSGAAPTSGSFRYDPDVPVFSDFIVVWTGDTFNMTASANNPIATGACDTPGNGAADTFDFLLNQNCGNGQFSNGWSASRNTLGAAIQFGRSDDNIPPVDRFLIFADAGGGSSASSRGTFSISLAEAPVPEPATLSLLTASAALVAARFRIRRRLSAGDAGTRQKRGL